MSKANDHFIESRCIEIRQPIGTFYIASLSYSDLNFITYVDVRRIEKEKRDIETYLGIQRPLSPGRVKEISQYVNLVDACFPTGIILAIDSIEVKDDIENQNIQYDAKDSKLLIRRDQRVAKVIDGQHRIEGLKSFVGAPERFQLNVTIFVDMDIEDQAMVFATINKTQTKVSKSLVYDLYDFAHARSPQKTCHNIAKLLNAKSGSPFKDKIKILGKAYDKSQETITQATFVESLLQYISKDPMSDRNLLKLGKKLARVEGKELEKFFLRNMFIDERDAEIAKIVWNYFAAVRQKWPNAWEGNREGNILNKSTGFIALTRFLRDAYLSFDLIGTIIEQEQFSRIFSKINIADDAFTPDSYRPGSSGQGALYRELCEKSRILH
jgi:DGQHR domain-containing protein